MIKNGTYTKTSMLLMKFNRFMNNNWTKILKKTKHMLQELNIYPWEQVINKRETRDVLMWGIMLKKMKLQLKVPKRKLHNTT